MLLLKSLWSQRSDIWIRDNFIRKEIYEHFLDANEANDVIGSLRLC